MDRQTQPCDVARVGSRFAAITTHGNGVVEIVATGIGTTSIKLQRLVTLERYPQGSRNDRTSGRAPHNN